MSLEEYQDGCRHEHPCGCEEEYLSRARLHVRDARELIVVVRATATFRLDVDVSVLFDDSIFHLRRGKVVILLDGSAAATDAADILQDFVNSVLWHSHRHSLVTLLLIIERDYYLCRFLLLDHAAAGVVSRVI